MKFINKLTSFDYKLNNINSNTYIIIDEIAKDQMNINIYLLNIYYILIKN